MVLLYIFIIGNMKMDGYTRK